MQAFNLDLKVIPKIYKVLYQPARIKVLYGGRGSGKSWAVADYMLLCALKGEKILCTRQYLSTISDSVHSLLERRIFDLNLQNYFDIKNNEISSKFNSTIIFKGLAKDINGIRSMNGINKVWIEEGDTLAKESFGILSPTIREENSEIIICFNPNFSTDFVFARFSIDNLKQYYPDYVNDDLSSKYYKHRLEAKFIYDACDANFIKVQYFDTVLNEFLIPDLIVNKINYYDNPYFPAVLSKEAQLLKNTDYDLYLNWYEGYPKNFSDALVFGGKYRVAEFLAYDAKKDEGGLHFGLDFGFNPDPLACTRSFIREENGKKSLYIEYEAYDTNIDIDAIPDFLDKNIPDVRKYKIIADSARPEIIANLKRKGFNINACYKYSPTKGDFVEEGITFMRSFYEIVIHPRCENTIKEFGLYRHKTDKNTGEILPDIIDKYNHAIDAIRYSLEKFINVKVTAAEAFRRNPALYKSILSKYNR